METVWCAVSFSILDFESSVEVNSQHLKWLGVVPMCFPK